MGVTHHVRGCILVSMLVGGPCMVRVSERGWMRWHDSPCVRVCAVSHHGGVGGGHDLC